MSIFTKKLGNSMLSMMVAIGAIASSTASAELIRTPFAGIPDANPTAMSTQDWLNKLNDRMKTRQIPFQAEEIPSGFGPLWSADMTMSDAEGECDDSQMRRLADGGYIAVYTCGGGEKILEGRIVRLSESGEKMWETVLQGELYTTANKVCQGADGRFFVLGTTQENGFTQSYIACFDADGKQVYMNVNEDNMAMVNTIEIATVADKTVIVYITSTANYGGDRTLVARWFDASGVQTEELTRSINSATNEYTSRLGDFLMVPLYTNEAYAIDLKNADIALNPVQESGSVYYNGCASEDALYTLHKNPSSMLVLTQYQIEDGKLVEKWSCTTRQENSGYDSFAYPLNEGKVMVYNKQRQGGPGIAIINPDGSKEQDKTEVNFLEYNSAWPYAATQAADGTIYIFGMYAENMTYGISVLTMDADLKNPSGTVYNNLDPDFTLYYTQYDRSYFTDGEFVYSGYMRPEDYSSHGYTPIFGTYSISDDKLQLLYKGDTGKIARVEPGRFSVDATDNVYMTLTSNGKPVLVKYNKNGEQEWVKYIDSEGQLFKPVILSNGNVCTGTFSNGIKTVCYTPEGEEVYDVTDDAMLVSLSYIRDAYAIESNDNSIIIACSGYNSSTQTVMPYITKVDADGTISSKFVTEFDESSNVGGITGDSEGNIYILGDSSNNEGISCPMILKINSNLEIVESFVQPIDVYCSLNLGKVDSEGRIFVVGNTWYHGMLFVYDKEFKLLGYHIFDTSTYSQSVYQSLSLTSEGNAIISVSYMDENWRSYSVIVCYDDKAELQWKYEHQGEGQGQYNLYDAAQYGDGILAAGYYNSSIGAQNYAVILNADREIKKEFFSPQEKGYNSYSFRNANIVNGNAYIDFSYSNGKAMFGNLTCFGNPSALAVDELNSMANSEGIIVEAGYAALASGEKAQWEVFTTAGSKLISTNATQLNLNGLASGLYIITAKNADKLHTIKISK